MKTIDEIAKVTVEIERLTDEFAGFMDKERRLVSRMLKEDMTEEGITDETFDRFLDVELARNMFMTQIAVQNKLLKELMKELRKDLKNE